MSVFHRLLTLLCMKCAMSVCNRLLTLLCMKCALSVVQTLTKIFNSIGGLRKAQVRDKLSFSRKYNEIVLGFTAQTHTPPPSKKVENFDEIFEEY